MTIHLVLRSPHPLAVAALAAALTVALSPAVVSAGPASADCRMAAAAQSERAPAPGDPCDPRVATFSTVGEFTELTFGAGGVPPIPPEFFFPGSQPFFGGVALSGVPLAPGEGDADTAVQLGGLPSVEGGEYPSVAAPVSVRLAGLGLSSIDPITVEGADGEGEEWLVGVDLGSAQRQGSLSARFDSPEGGSFDATLPLSPVVVFVRLADVLAVLDGGLDPSEVEVRFLDFQELGLEPIELAFHEVPFATADVDGDGCGGFEPGFLPGGEPVLVSTAEPFVPVRHVFEPPPLPPKKCHYAHGSTTASDNPECLPACPGVVANYTKGQCKTIADCPQFQIDSFKCAQQGHCVAVYVVTSCS